MTRDELLAGLRHMASNRHRDIEHDHGWADDALLELLNDPEITEAFNAIERWYA